MTMEIGPLAVASMVADNFVGEYSVHIWCIHFGSDLRN